jgi:hemolysin activation/secretion protein
VPAGIAAEVPASSGDAAAAPQSAPPKASDRRFPVLKILVEGNSRLPRVDVERAVMPYLGLGKTIKDVEAARQNLEKLYHAQGFQTVLVNIPPQEVSNGVVRLKVVEAPVGELAIKGSKYHSLDVIRSDVPDLQPGSVPEFGQVQKELGDLNHTQDLHVTPVLRASTTPGKVDVDLDVQDQLPLHGMLELDNRYSPNTSHLRLSGELSYDNLFQSNQSASIQYQTAPTHTADAKIWSGSYVIPTHDGPVFALYVVHSDSDIAAVGDVNVIGKGDVYGLRIIEPLPSGSASFFHNFTGGIDYKDFKQNVVLQGSDQLASPARYPLFTLAYTATWLGPADAKRELVPAVSSGRNSTTLTLGTSFLVRFIGGTDAEQFAVKRFDADPNFLVFKPQIERQQILPGSWSFDVRMAGQLASGPLISNEQYSAGGVDTVRGYAESERLGDDGVDGTLELRSPQLLPKFWPSVQQGYFYFFGDGALLRIVDPLPRQVTSFRLGSFGLGWRSKLAGLTFDLDGARAGSEGYVTHAGSYSAQFKVNYAW